MLKSSRKRRRWESEIDAALKNERASDCNRKPLIRQPSRLSHKVKGVTLGTLQEIWPSVKWASSLG